MPCKEEEKNEVLNRAARYSIVLVLEGLAEEEYPEQASQKPVGLSKRGALVRLS